MKRIMIFYHSGAGSTKTIGEVLKEKLSAAFEVEIQRVEKNFDYGLIKSYDFLIFGFPVYGLEASQSMKEFVEAMPASGEPKKCFIYSTSALASANSISKLAQKLYEKNIITTGYMRISAPASDGALMFPASWQWVRSYRKRTPEKMDNAVLEIAQTVQAPDLKSNMPPYRHYWGVVEKLLLKSLRKQEQGFMEALRIGEERCTNCNYCVSVCKRGCITGGDKHPEINVENCELCLGCVHHCPNKAITISRKYIDNPRLNEKFFKTQKMKLLGK